jgi:hypothetical protein
MPAKVTGRSRGVIRGRGVLFGRIRKDSFKTAERYGSLSSEAGDGRGACFASQLAGFSYAVVGEEDVDKAVMQGLSESNSERRRS